MSTLRQLFHELLGHKAWVEVVFERPSRRRGVLIECDCGTRWIGRDRFTRGQIGL
nr:MULTISPECIES: hypothetical protein [unclassified Rhodococcus (in: high G+C Gram-positive bacteria)]